MLWNTANLGIDIAVKINWTILEKNGIKEKYKESRMSSLWPSPSGKWTKISFSDDLNSRAYREDVTKCVLHNDSDVDSDEDDAWMSQLEKDYDSSRRCRRRRTWTMYERRVTTALSVFVMTTVALAFLILYRSHLRWVWRIYLKSVGLLY